MNLKNKIAAIVLAVATMSVTANAQLVSFEFATIAGNEASVNATLYASNVTNTTSITRGSGLTAAANGDRFNATAWSTGALDATDYFAFTVTPDAGYQISFTSIDINHQRSSTGPVSFALRSSVDTYASDLGSVVTISDVATIQSSTFTFGLNNITTATEFRIYGYTAESAAGSWGIGDFTGNDLIVNGSVTAVPEPSTYAAIIGGLVLGVAVWRRRKVR